MTVERYLRAVDDLGTGKSWYQTGGDVLFAAVVATVDELDGDEIRSRASTLSGSIENTDPLHYVLHTVAAVAAARGIGITEFLDDTSGLTDALRPSTRLSQPRRIAAAIAALSGSRELDERASAIMELYDSWNGRQRLRTTASDLPLAAITVAADTGVDRAAHDATVVYDELGRRGYGDEWDVARILALERPDAPMHRFLAVCERLRGRRRKPVSDRRPAIAFAALGHHDITSTVGLVAERADAVRVGRFKPDPSWAVTLAALMTLGESVEPDHGLRTAFHGAVIAQHYEIAARRAG